MTIEVILWAFIVFPGLSVDSCLHSESPSGQNRKCQQFERAMGVEAMPRPGESIMIVYGKRRKKTMCYHKRAGE